MSAARQGKGRATCFPLEMLKWVFVTASNCTSIKSSTSSEFVTEFVVGKIMNRISSVVSTYLCLNNLGLTILNKCKKLTSLKHAWC